MIIRLLKILLSVRVLHASSTILTGQEVEMEEVVGRVVSCSEKNWKINFTSAGGEDDCDLLIERLLLRASLLSANRPVFLSLVIF